MVHVGLHSVGTYHKKFGWEKKNIKNILCRVLELTLGKAFSTECQLVDTQQKSIFAECPRLALGKS
jgi:hypothetical protein